MLDKVVRGTESRGDLIEVFTSMAADLGVEQKAPAPVPVPEPEPVCFFRLSCLVIRINVFLPEEAI